jgi:hypothetical protein
MTSDPNKKTQRTFQCRDALWLKFEQMARELECSVDYLINDAMKQYARQRGYSSTGVHSLSPAAMRPPPPPPLGVGPPPPPPPPVPGIGARGLSSVPARSMPSGAPGPSSTQRPTAQPPPLSRGVPVPPPPPPPGVARSATPPPMPRSVHPPPPPVAPQYTGSLAIYYQGERFPINKDRFIIGRGKQSSDLTIKDPNVSRQHAMIEFLNGQYYIVDMGSTNGVEYNGQRVQRKIINEGDVFRVCDHELQFSFH